MDTRKIVGVCALVVLVGVGVQVFRQNADRAQAELGRMGVVQVSTTTTVDPCSRWMKACPEETKLAEKSIVAQLNAFKADDYLSATKFQASSLRRSTLDIARFRTMIVSDYPEFAHYKSISFGAAESDGDGCTLSIPVSVTGMDGVSVKAVYLMSHELGTYRVAGVSGGFGHVEQKTRPVEFSKQELLRT